MVGYLLYPVKWRRAFIQISEEFKPREIKLRFYRMENSYQGNTGEGMPRGFSV